MIYVYSVQYAKKSQGKMVLRKYVEISRIIR